MDRNTLNPNRAALEPGQGSFLQAGTPAVGKGWKVNKSEMVLRRRKSKVPVTKEHSTPPKSPGLNQSPQHSYLAYTSAIWAGLGMAPHCSSTCHPRSAEQLRVSVPGLRPASSTEGSFLIPALLTDGWGSAGTTQDRRIGGVLNSLPLCPSLCTASHKGPGPEREHKPHILMVLWQGAGRRYESGSVAVTYFGNAICHGVNGGG